MKKAYIWILVGVIIFSFFFEITNVSALLYTPSVEIGDEIVWEYQAEYLSYKHTYFLKHIITEIYDSDESTTKVCANESLYEEKTLQAVLAINSTRGLLEDYMQKDTIDYLLSPINPGCFYIVPGTKIGIYADVYSNQSAYENSSVISLSNAYGIEIINVTNPFAQFSNKTCIYTESGILEKFHGEKGSDYFRKYDLYSINGKKYHEIPGFSTTLLLLFCFLAVIVIFRKTKST